MRAIPRTLVAIAASAAMMAGSTAAIAAAPAAPAPQSPWMTLSKLNTAGAMSLAASGVAAQVPPGDVPPPQAHGIGMPPIPVLVIWLATLATFIWIITANDHHHRGTAPNSPA